jgi:hypothetical protein
LRVPPGASGSEVVGAAAMAPVGALVSPLRTMAERRTCLSVRTSSLTLRCPGSPPGKGLFKTLVQFFRRWECKLAFVQFFGASEHNGQIRALAFPDGAGPCKGVSLPQFEFHVGRDEEAAAAADGDEIIVAPSNPSFDCSVFETWNKIDAEFHTAFHSLDDPQNLCVRVMFSTLSDRHAVNETRHATVGSKGRLEYERVLQILARNAVR